MRRALLLFLVVILMALAVDSASRDWRSRVSGLQSEIDNLEKKNREVRRPLHRIVVLTTKADDG
jgi:hypothetical protein